ncbi:MAG TPA: hypothetical protein VG497_30635 [Kribbella sp.]|nr:hypothetical protein [Kribbella sp.]
MQDVELPEVTLADVVLEIRRIADVIAPRPRDIARSTCGARHAGSICVLDDRHRGPHASGDGQTRWVDDD